MNPRYRIYAAVGLAGVVLLGGGFMVLGRGSSAASTAAPAIKPLHPVSKASKHAARAATGKRTVATAKPKPSAATVAKTPLAPPSVSKAATPDGIPAGLSAALKKHPVVVVSLVLPGGAVDQLAYQEAKAGAARAGAGFVRISTADNRAAQALATLVNSDAQPNNRLLDAPAVLVFRRPAELYVRINGYIDADTVAQAAENAAPLPQAPSGQSTLGVPE